MTRRARLDAWTIAACAALWLAPSFDEIARDASERGPEENELRAAAPLPPAPKDLASLCAWPRAAEAWLDDPLGGRARAQVDLVSPPTRGAQLFVAPRNGTGESSMCGFLSWK